MNSLFKSLVASPIGKHHFFEVYLSQDLVAIRKLGLDVDVRRGGNHNGLFVTVGLLGRALSVELYDTRHKDMK